MTAMFEYPNRITDDTRLHCRKKTQNARQTDHRRKNNTRRCHHEGSETKHRHRLRERHYSLCLGERWGAEVGGGRSGGGEGFRKMRKCNFEPIVFSDRLVFARHFRHETIQKWRK